MGVFRRLWGGEQAVPTLPCQRGERLLCALSPGGRSRGVSRAAFLLPRALSDRKGVSPTTACTRPCRARRAGRHVQVRPPSDGGREAPVPVKGGRAEFCAGASSTSADLAPGLDA